MRIAMTTFALRNWDPEATSTRIVDFAPDAMVDACNNAVSAGDKLVEGYAPFCTHLFLRNPSPTRCSFAPILNENVHLLRSGYRSRREGELAVLERWFEGLEAPVAKYLDVILYSYDQLVKEAADFPEEQAVPDCDWGIVSIIGTLKAEEPPMPPITQLRNALGRSEGGSGRPIDVTSYVAATDFWDKHAAVK